MATRFDAATLELLHKAQEVAIRTSRQPKRGIVIWAVVVGDSVFVRSVRATRGQWFLAAASDGQAELEVADRNLKVRTSAVTDRGVLDAVSQAYLGKYATSPYAKEMVRTETLPTTLRLDPA